MADCVILKDIQYGNHERHTVDILIPEKAESASGLMLFIHGGGWTQGDKAGHFADAQHFCKRGYISATMNYRFVSETINVFDELDDITAALKTVKEKCTEYGFNIEKVMLSGGSAGGHLSLLYAYTRQNEAPVTPAAACVYCPPVSCSRPDFLLGISGEFEDWKYGVLSKCCGVQITKESLMDEHQQKALNKISPAEYVSENSIPTAVFHGKCDAIIPVEHIYDFIRLLNETGVKNDLLIYENSDHGLDKDPEAATQSRNIIKAYAEMYF